MLPISELKLYCVVLLYDKVTNRKKKYECRHEERRRKCVTTGGDRGGHRVNPARISAPDETKIARRRVRLHAARQCRRAGTPRAPRRLSAGKLTLRLIAERAEASPICGGGAAGPPPPPPPPGAAHALAPLTTSYSWSHLFHCIR